MLINYINHYRIVTVSLGDYINRAEIQYLASMPFFINAIKSYNYTVDTNLASSVLASTCNGEKMMMMMMMV